MTTLIKAEDVSTKPSRTSSSAQEYLPGGRTLLFAPISISPGINQTPRFNLAPPRAQQMNSRPHSTTISLCRPDIRGSPQRHRSQIENVFAHAILIANISATIMAPFTRNERNTLSIPQGTAIQTASTITATTMSGSRVLK